MICYAACAICLTKVDQIDQLVAEAEAEGEVDFDMVHFLMSKLPKLYVPSDDALPQCLDQKVKISSDGNDSLGMTDTTQTISEQETGCPFKSEGVTDDLPVQSDQTSPNSVTQSMPSDAANPLKPSATHEFLPDILPLDRSMRDLPKPPIEERKQIDQDAISVEIIIQSALTLFYKYPPTDPRLKINTILGPKSCLYTWEQTQAAKLSDLDAEAILTQSLDCIVLPDLVQLRKEERKRQRKAALERSLRRKRMVKEVTKQLFSRNGLLAGSVVIGILSVVYFRRQNEIVGRLAGFYNKLSSLITRVLSQGRR